MEMSWVLESNENNNIITYGPFLISMKVTGWSYKKKHEPVSGSFEKASKSHAGP